ncbi:M48 family metalloprotease [Ruegeria sp. PrR005]|uniref:M48 family metalloprotease n=1 Tax=Ruegeria sp. PrR005 TaxID=2706882 RepID=A0A6B2NUQ9_9RHOB|nr:M48 family metalloprotease [Ruegeria sp. PrR005]NDW45635.1 M48 family metalloprotease [Ruegeria sp. PrR005]
MAALHRNLYRLLLAGLFVLSAVMLATSPTRYKVDLDALMGIWGDVIRDVDSVVRTIRISTELEIEFGDEIAGVYSTTPSGVGDQEYVAAVGAKVAAQTRRSDIPWTFHIVDAQYSNAWAILGGHVFITTGMLDEMESEAELAGILGHEIAHIDLYHCVNLVQNQMILERLGLGDIGAIIALGERFLLLGYSEVEEAEADRYGMLLTAQAGYSPLNVFDTFRRFYLREEYGQESEASRGPEGEIIASLSTALEDYFNTHPPFSDRLDALRAMLDANARGWEGKSFRVGRTTYADRTFVEGDAAPGENWTFSKNAPDYLAARAELAFLLGRDAEAERYLGRLREIAPEDTRIGYLSGLLAGRIEPERPSVMPSPGPAIETPEPKIPQEVRDLAQDGWDEFKNGRYAEAIRKLEEAIARAPEYRWALGNLAWVYAAAGLPEYRKPERAIFLAERAIEIEPRSAYLDTLGNAYILIGEHTRARDAYDRAIAIEQEYREMLRNDLVYLGYLTAGAPDSDLTEALTKAIETGHAPFVLAESRERIMHLMTSDLEQARAEYEFLSILYPFHPDIATLATGLGITHPVERIDELSVAGDFVAAVELGRDLLWKDPENLQLKRALSSALFELARREAGDDNPEDALAHYTEAIDLRDGVFAVALNNRAILHAKGDDTYLALLDINRALRIDPEKSLYHANRCLFLRLRGQNDSALTSCEMAFEVGLPADQGNRSWVYLQRGTVRRLLGDLDGASADFRGSVQLARSEIIRKVQELMAAAGFYSETVDGQLNDALLQAVENCIRFDECYAQAVGQMDYLIDFLQ